MSRSGTAAKVPFIVVTATRDGCCKNCQEYIKYKRVLVASSALCAMTSTASLGFFVAFGSNERQRKMNNEANTSKKSNDVDVEENDVIPVSENFVVLGIEIHGTEKHATQLVPRRSWTEHDKNKVIC